MQGPRADARAVAPPAPASNGRGAGAPAERLRHLPRACGVPQTARLLGWGLATAGEAALSAPLEALSAAGAARRDARRARAARRLTGTLGALKGAFAKAGQFAAIRYDVLPPEVTGPLAALRDRVPPLPFRRVRAVVERELGAPLDALFSAFEPEPLGAASIAQVHRARLPGGEPVAVKVQYPWLRASLRADLALAGALLRLFAGRSPDRDRVLAEFSRGLREELDFEREARVAREIAANLADDPQVRVPRVFASHSTARVLTASYQPAVPIGDREGLARLGVSPRAVLEVVGRAYARQVFVDGLFHADPHPGNLFVLDEPTAAETPRVLFVDFGLSRRLEPELRRAMRRGLMAVLQRDVDAFVAAMDDMGMIAPGAHDRARRAVADMLGRIGEAGALGLAGGQVLGLKDQAKALLQETPGVQLPNDLLLYARTMTYVFGLGAEIAPDVDLMKVCLPYLLQFLGEKD